MPPTTSRWTLYLKLIRFDRPIGTLLLLWPTLWGLWIAAAGVPDLIILMVFVLGTFLMRSAGCAINDVADRDFDANVERTKTRPLAMRQIHPVEALLVAAVLALLALALVVIFLNRLTLLLSVVAALLAASYPFTKRFFVMPQAYLGLAFGFGIPMAFAAQTGSVPTLAWALLAASALWTIAYDTEYAMVDRDDDVRLGLHTSAILFGRWDVAAIMLAYSGTLALLALIGAAAELKWPFYAALIGANGIVVYHYRLIRKRQRDGCFRAFSHNHWLGALIFFGIALSYVV